MIEINTDRRGLSIFAPTADQRYSLGEDIFLRTHYTINLRRYKSDGSVDQVSEDKLLNNLLDCKDLAPGNRLWILYGAPGSGKSELLKWLEIRTVQETPSRASVTIRISRTEIDPLRIIERFSSLLPESFLSEAIYHRWQIARQKPRTLAKLILLLALDRLLDSDEIINALFYRLLSAIQPFVEQTIAANETMDAFEQIELISQETWDAILSETAIEVPIAYEQFRHQMIVAFSEHLLEGVSLPNILSQISNEVHKNQVDRPLLLIDDLVQSLNLFATDILDYFITLDEGNWDVVVGLTPAAIETSARGRNLLQRITYLDTIDDRVEKLWLSDETGRDSYSLTEQNCHDFAAHYLREYHRINGWQNKSKLYPFNREALIRLFRGLPAGKGKARYFTRVLRHVLQEIAEGESLLHAMAQYARIESVARCEDPNLASLCELYGPLVSNEKTYSVTLSAALLECFGLPSRETEIPVEPLIKVELQREAITRIVDDDGKIAIRDWLFEKPVNRQLLKRVRQGTARWLRLIQYSSDLHHDHIAAPKAILGWQKTYLQTRPPICFEGIDDNVDGITIPRDIGILAFDLNNYATAKGDTARTLSVQLANEPGLTQILFASLDYRNKVFNQLTDQLGMPVEKFALSLYVFSLVATGFSEYTPPGFSNDFLAELERMHLQLLKHIGQSDKQLNDAIQDLFADFFRLRKNLFDGPKIASLLGDSSPLDTLNSLERIDASNIDKNYRFGGNPIGELLTKIQGVILNWKRTLESELGLSPAAQSVLYTLTMDVNSGIYLNKIPNEVLEEIKTSKPEVYSNFEVKLRLSERS